MTIVPSETNETQDYAHNSILRAFLQRRGLSVCDMTYLLNPQSSHQHNPFLLKGIHQWIDKLHTVKGQRVAIIPDYDADGVLSGTLCRVGLFVLGFGDVYIYPPKTRDGYGLTKTSIDQVVSTCPDVSVILTTDNGSNAHEGIAYAKSKGLTVLVTDHHVAQTPPPADAVINPNGHGDNTYPFTHISGTAVIYKALTAYAYKYGTPGQLQELESLVFLVGISLISDVMPMLDENRYYVTRAVDMLAIFMKGHSVERIVSYNDTPLHQYYRGVDLLVFTLHRHNRLKYGIDADTFGFLIGPMLNSPRRMTGESELAFSLFQTKREPLLNGHTALPSDVLYALNEERKAYVRKLTATLFRHIATSERNPIEYAVFNARMGAGVAGLLSGKFTEAYGLPSVAFSVKGEAQHLNDIVNVISPPGTHLTGSARSPESFNLHAFLSQIDKDYPGLIKSWGGHPQAAGIHLHAENYLIFQSIFTERLRALIVEETPSDTTVPFEWGGDFILANDVYDALTTSYAKVHTPEIVRMDRFLPLMAHQELVEAVRFFEHLAPFGQGFPEPTFSVAFSVRDVRVFFMGQEKQHVKFILPNGLTVIDWNGASAFQGDLTQDPRILIATGTLSVNTFGGKESLQMVSNGLVEVT